ncbi:hypothetical protein EJ08DRAFT_706699 [Tothia fuscella]|uniref:Uncharacterized protein n=1 Tax=Tothia fuscella TaxID=1048955 RepID=A0A9P4NFF8_9PEZI|nr:hypothetical protein EJ08DRAFT_706699 [Tothia fuscella]
MAKFSSLMDARRIRKKFKYRRFLKRVRGWLEGITKDLSSKVNSDTLPAPFPFLELPGELRNQIYEIFLHGDYSHEITPVGRYNPMERRESLSPAQEIKFVISSVSSQIRREVISLYLHDRLYLNFDYLNSNSNLNLLVDSELDIESNLDFDSNLIDEWIRTQSLNTISLIRNIQVRSPHFLPPKREEDRLMRNPPRCYRSKNYPSFQFRRLDDGMKISLYTSHELRPEDTKLAPETVVDLMRRENRHDEDSLSGDLLLTLAWEVGTVCSFLMFDEEIDGSEDDEGRRWKWLFSAAIEVLDVEVEKVD